MPMLPVNSSCGTSQYAEHGACTLNEFLKSQEFAKSNGNYLEYCGGLQDGEEDDEDDDED